MMRIRIVLVLAAAAVVMGACCPAYKWNRIVVDAHMTGVSASDADNVDEAFGTVRDGVYYAPNGRVFDSGTTPAQAGLLIGAQDSMRDLKQVIAYAPRDMSRKGDALRQWFIDFYMKEVEKETGRKVDVGLTNEGGIRVDIAAGNVQKDDLVSMFPFRNHIIYASVKGSELVRLMEFMVADKDGVQVVGGVKLVVDGKKIVSLEVGGQEVAPDRMYGLATVDFLLYGGDGYRIADYASEIIVGDKYVIDVVLPYVMELTARGEMIEHQVDDRVVYLDKK